MNKVFSKIPKQRISSLSYFGSLLPGDRNDERQFLENLSEIFGPGTSVVPIGRARMGIHLLAKLSLTKEKRRVVMSPFTIPDVVNMVVLAGAEPVFYDFEKFSTSIDLDGLSSLIDERTAAIIITHYHVNEPRIAEIRSMARGVGAYLFDDCAISFGGTVNGQPVGVLTDASIFSFSSFKTLNFFWGGLITTRNRFISTNISEVVESWPRLKLSDYAPAIKACARYDVATRPIPFNFGVFPLIQARVRRSDSSEGFEHVRIESEGIHHTLKTRPALSAFREWSKKLPNTIESIRRRRDISSLYREHLGEIMVGSEVEQSIINGSCFCNFPIVVNPSSRTEIFRRLIISGFDVGKALYPNCHRHEKFRNYLGNSSNADSLVASTIYLPTHFAVTKKYAMTLALKVRGLVEELS